MTPDSFLDLSIKISLWASILAFFIIAIRLVLGPSLSDRVLALDSLVTVGIGFIAIVAIKTRYALYIDVAIALGLVGFLATVALARFILRRDGLAAGGVEPNETNAEQLNS